MFTKLMAVLIGSTTLAVGINFFLVPYKILDGGMIGVALILKYLWGLKAGGMIILLSIPVYALAWVHSRGLFFNSLHGMLISSLFIDLLRPGHYQYLSVFHLTPVIGAILGGLFVGLGIGIMLRYETSTGGTDLLAQVISKFFPINVGILIFFIDGLVILLGGLIFAGTTFFLSLLTIFVVGILTTICVSNRFQLLKHLEDDFILVKK